MTKVGAFIGQNGPPGVHTFCQSIYESDNTLLALLYTRMFCIGW